jgi:hypothetical protein
MDSSELTRDQAKRLREQLLPILRYLEALRTRIDQQAWPKSDRIRHNVEATFDAVHRLTVELHYLSCPGVAGHTARERGS